MVEFQGGGGGIFLRVFGQKNKGINLSWTGEDIHNAIDTHKVTSQKLAPCASPRLPPLSPGNASCALSAWEKASIQKRANVSPPLALARLRFRLHMHPLEAASTPFSSFHSDPKLMVKNNLMRAEDIHSLGSCPDVHG